MSRLMRKKTKLSLGYRAKKCERRWPPLTDGLQAEADILRLSFRSPLANNTNERSRVSFFVDSATTATGARAPSAAFDDASTKNGQKIN